MRALLDTCIISELGRAQCHPAVRHAVSALGSDSVFVSVISLGEVAKGVALLKESRRKHLLQSWLQALERDYGDRLLPVDLETSHIWGELTAAAQKAGKIVPSSDGLIAATARRYGLHLMTRNTSHFAYTGVLFLNPWMDQ